MRIAIALLSIMALEPAVSADEPPDTSAFRGKAFIAGGVSPATGITLHFFNFGTPEPAVVTDEGGRFHRAVPAGFSLAGSRDGGIGPPCWVQAHDAARWTWKPIRFGLRAAEKSQRRMAAEPLVKRIKTTWRERGELMNLEVECPPMGEVEVLVRGADGSPLADRPVQVIPAWSEREDRGLAAIQFDGRTDDAGRFRMRWFEGLRRLGVLVPGEGYGSTGFFAVRAGQVAHQETPPLARLGSIEGRLDPKLAGASTTVVLDDHGIGFGRATCDAEGRFALRDVLPGPYWVRGLRDGSLADIEPVAVWVAPGQRIAGVVLGPAPAFAARDQRQVPAWAQARGAGRRRAAGRAEEIVLVEGGVRDERGRRLAGAEISTCLYLPDPHAGREAVRTTTADDQGHYQIRGPRSDINRGLTAIARAEGCLPALAHSPAPGADGRPPTLDLTLALASGERGGAARVTAIKDGQPMAGASLGLALDCDVPPSFWMAVGNGLGGDAIAALIHPTAVTGPDGVARFAGLFPGSYRPTLIEPQPVPVARGRFGPAMRPNRLLRLAPRAVGLNVSEGRETAFVLALHTSSVRGVRLQVVRPDGTPLAGRTVSLSRGPRSAHIGFPMKLDGQGIGRATLGHGLASVDIRFRDADDSSYPLDSEPYYQAEALVPASPALAPEEKPIRLVAVRREPGSLRVRLLGADGRPARGTVEILEPRSRPGFAASTNGQGLAVFRDLPSGTYPLRASIEQRAEGPKPKLGPAEDAALGGHAMVALQMATVTSGAETVVELCAQPVGYVRGRLRPTASRAAAEYLVVLDADGRDDPQRLPRNGGSGAFFAFVSLTRVLQESRSAWDTESGQFLSGPLLPGAHGIRFRHQAEDGSWQDAGSQSVTVAAGEVTRIELRPGPDGSPVPGDGGPGATGESPRAVVDTVVLADGKTPAFAARASLFVPGDVQPVASGISDAAGRLTWHQRWTQGQPTAGEPAKPVDRPTVVVRIPGRTGAAILAVEPHRRARVVLPAPRAAEGRITLGGRPIGGRNARLRVAAAYTGRGVLDEAIGLEATVQPDGRFELRGLTPGRCTIQAARDEIWLSRSIELTVAPDKDPPPIDLDIPEPGAPLTLQVVDREGRPVADQPIGLVRPEGPLASLWPASLRTDPGGTLTLRGLEAGRHTLLVGETKARREIVIPAAGGAGGAENPSAVERIVVPRAGP